MIKAHLYHPEQKGLKMAKKNSSYVSRSEKTREEATAAINADNNV